MKVCTKCGVTKCLTSFHKDKSKKSGYRSACKECYKVLNKKRYWDDPEKERQRIQKYRQSLTENERYLQNRNSKLKKAYGLTHEQVEEMKKLQNYCYFICNTYESEVGSKGLVVDHNHTTGKVRKLLCSSCNTAIGLLKENIDIVEKVKQYLSKA